jgi:NADPH-dependent curcumin reductase CurA
MTRRASIHGYLVIDHADRYGEAIEYLARLIAECRLTQGPGKVD